MFEHEGTSDLAVVELKHRVEEHEDYKLGPPLHIIKLATEAPKPDDSVLTAGWGLTGYNEEPSEELRSLELITTRVWSRDVWSDLPFLQDKFNWPDNAQTLHFWGFKTKCCPQVEDLWLYTDIYDENDRLIDPCKGDSGGPLAIKRNGQWELVGVLNVCFCLKT